MNAFGHGKTGFGTSSLLGAAVIVLYPHIMKV